MGHSQTARKVTAAPARIHRAGDQRMEELSGAGLSDCGSITSISGSGPCDPARVVPRPEYPRVSQIQGGGQKFLNKIELKH
jgi:hypothetical protein